MARQYNIGVTLKETRGNVEKMIRKFTKKLRESGSLRRSKIANAIRSLL